MRGVPFGRVLRQALTALIVVVSVAVLSAQTVIDPRTVEFDPSPDHSAVVNGTALVQSYSLMLYETGASTPFETVSLGKPAPGTDGKIRVDFIALLSAVPPPDVVYEARVAAIGPGGTTPSTASNGFSFSAPCAPSITPASQSFVAAGGTGSVAVGAATGCAWTAASNATWITVTGGASGSGNGTVTYSVAPNTAITQRTGSMTIAGQTFVVTQAAAPCTFSISPTSRSFTASGGTGSISMTTVSGCTWAATTTATWITITSGASGNGSGTVGYTVAANPSTSPRTGTITVGGQTFTVSQSGAPCTYSIAPTTQSVTAAGGTGSIAMTAPAGCAWTATTTQSWITITGGATGSGNGTITFTVAANSSTSQRTGTITVGGQTFTVTQSGAACTYSISPVRYSPSSAGGSAWFTVTAAAGCAWTATPSASWITITAGATGSGNGSVDFTVAPNPSISPRTGTITVGGQIFTVSQSGATCTYSVLPLSQTFTASGGTGSAAVTAPTGCSWTASTAANWITVTAGATGNGNGTVTFTVAANTSTSPRTGTLIIAGQTFTVTQQAAPCSYAISPTSQSVAAGGGSGLANVTAGEGCAWTASSNAAWITLTSPASGSGDGGVTFSVAANPTTSARTGTLTIAGRTFTVNQAGATCTFTLSPVSQSVTASGGTGSFTVSAASGCAWTATSSASWLTVTGGATGNGNGTVSFSVAANTTISQRTGTITVGGQTFTVTQAGVPCSYSVSPLSQTVTSSGGSGSATVTAPAGCTWTTTTAASWITVTAGATGSGNGTASFTVAPNASTSPRTGTLVIAGQTFTVTQQAAPCTYAISPTSQSLTSAGGTGSITLTTPTGCAWTATTAASWITITGGASGSGNGTVTFSVAANTTISSRTGTITAGGQTFTVTQAGVPCTFSLSPTSHSATSAGGSSSFAVATSAGCTWSATTSANWITVTSGATGNGNGTVAFTVAANTTISPRTGTISAGGQTFTVTQAGVPCSYSVAPLSQTVTSSGGTGSATVTAPSGCAWTSTTSVSWIGVTSGATGMGNGTVTFSVAPNVTTSSRTGTLVIAGQTFTVTQQAAPCTFVISPTSQSVTAAGGSGSTSVTAPDGCAWTASSGATWITLTSTASGSGSGGVTFSVAPNTTASPRTGTLTVAGQTFTVNQAAAPCTYTLSPVSQSLTASGGTGSFTVAVASGCAWTATSSASWLTVTGGATGNGNGTVSFSVAANGTISQRTATISVGGQTFTVTQAGTVCTYSVAPLSQSVPSSGGSGTATVTAPAGCAWRTTTTDSWITITGGALDSGNGTASFTIAPNASTLSRTGTLVIAGQTFTVTQAGAPCTYAISPTSQSLTSAGGTGSIAMTSPTGCAWTAATAASWISITGGATGSGNGTVTFSVAANSTITQRTGTITVGGQTFTVTQAGTPCTFTLSPVSQSLTATGGTGSFTVSAVSGCTWSATSSAAWITVTGGATGNGNGTVSFSVAANGTISQRTGTISVGGQTFTVTQAGVPCTYSVAPLSQTVVAGGGTGSATVTAPAGCSWTTTTAASWITVTGGSSGSGNGTASFSVAPNASTSQRTGTLAIAGQTFTVTQAGAPCTYAISPTSQSVPASGGSGSANVTAGAGCAWTASSGTAWITLTSPASGSGDGGVTFSVAPNTTASPRTGTLTIAGQTFTVTQSGATCSYTLSPVSQSLTASGGTGSFTVSAASGCAWTATVSASWISVTGGASGTGNGTVSFSVAANGTISQRTGTISVSGQTFTVTQAGTTCSYSVAPLSQTVTSNGGTGSATVTSPTGCAWTTTTSTTWITVTGGATGSGNGTATFSVAANPTTVQRSGTLTIAGQTFTVTQTAAACSYTISPTSQSVPATGGTGSANVAAAEGCVWSAGSAAAWITLTSATSGSGDGGVTFSVAANTSTAPRTGTLSIAGQTFTVNQAGVPCTFSLSPISQLVPAAGGTGSFTATGGTGCSWNATTSDTWITITGGGTGTGTGTVSFSVTANPGISQRTGTIAVSGQVFTVVQAGATCSYSVSPLSQSVASTGGAGSATVTAPAGCSWTADPADTWISVTSGASGSGNGSVAFSVSPNASTTPRTGTLTIAGQTLTVTQAAASCAFSVSPLVQSVSADGGTGSATVTAPTGCAWTAATNATWISIMGATSGDGDGAIAFSAAPNQTTSERTGTLTVAGQTVTVTQAGLPPCSYAISPLAQSMPSEGGSNSFNVSTAGGCSWTASTVTAWITLTAPQSGSGNGAVNYTVTPNTAASPRTGTIVVGGQTFTVTQAASSCTFAISPPSRLMSNIGGSNYVTVTASPGCSWTAVSNDSWLTVIGGAVGLGDGRVTYRGTANTGPARAGTLTIAGQTFTVNQAGVACSYTVSPTTISVSGGGGTGQITVSTMATCSWTAATSASWITLSGAGPGPGTATYTIAPNNGTTSRSTTMIVAGRGVQVSQAAAGPPVPPTGLRISGSSGGQ